MELASISLIKARFYYSEKNPTFASGVVLRYATHRLLAQLNFRQIVTDNLLLLNYNLSVR